MFNFNATISIVVILRDDYSKNNVFEKFSMKEKIFYSHNS